MRLSTALRVVGVIVVAKALLIGLVYWRRAEIIGRPVDTGHAIVVAVLTLALLGVALAVAARWARRR